MKGVLGVENYCGVTRDPKLDLKPPYGSLVSLEIR